jgi:hypothetical protein
VRADPPGRGGSKCRPVRKFRRDRGSPLTPRKLARAGQVQPRATPPVHHPDAPARVTRSLACASGLCSFSRRPVKCLPRRRETERRLQPAWHVGPNAAFRKIFVRFPADVRTPCEEVDRARVCAADQALQER